MNIGNLNLIDDLKPVFDDVSNLIQMPPPTAQECINVIHATPEVINLRKKEFDNAKINFRSFHAGAAI